MYSTKFGKEGAVWHLGEQVVLLCVQPGAPFRPRGGLRQRPREHGAPVVPAAQEDPSGAGEISALPHVATSPAKHSSG